MLKNIAEIERLFILYDTDESGLIDVRELYRMFKDNGITQITNEEFREIFKVVDSDGSGNISCQEFKRFVSDR